VHRAVDGKKEIITNTEVTPGQVNEAQRLSFLGIKFLFDYLSKPDFISSYHL
jgi:hypothetical protein